MSLNEKLRSMRETSRGKLPAETLQIMSEALKAIEGGGQHLRALKAGEQAPEFTLEDHTGTPWSSRQLLTQGPLVINFYRGSW